jgi:2-polyprenyl-6-methoxyphenol hydroxylase-like FAD-dependent oxidoreductase
MRALIIGGGIGGLTAALALQRAGIDVRVFEAVAEVKPLGVGINLLPQSVQILAEFGLLDQLAANAIRTKELVFFNRHGQRIWGDPRGLEAGHAAPQLSIHRGAVQMALFAAARRALGPERIRTGHRLVGFEQDDHGVTAHFVDRAGQALASERGDLLIGADGIHSSVRAAFHPREGMPKWNGVTMWRGMTRAQPFLSGRSMIQAGWSRQKFVCYPILPPRPDGLALINWIADLKGDSTVMLERESWNRPGKVADILPCFAAWRFDFLDVPAIIAAADAVFEFPMVDRDPLPAWSHGRVTLLGDAAHPLYPIGSAGATQAILDAVALADALVAERDPVAALKRYEATRLPPTAALVEMNRRQGLDRILDLVEERAPDGFSDRAEVLPDAELEAIVGTYKTNAGFRAVAR